MRNLTFAIIFFSCSDLLAISFSRECQGQLGRIREQIQSFSKDCRVPLIEDLNGLSHFGAALDPRIGFWRHRIYAIAKIAESLSKDSFGLRDQEGLGDALRHYVGANLLAQEFGVPVAAKILSSHEGRSYTIRSMMDRYNNKLALKDFEDLVLQESPVDELVRLARERIKEGKLVILRPPRNTVYPCDFLDFENFTVGFLKTQRENLYCDSSDEFLIPPP